MLNSSGTVTWIDGAVFNNTAPTFTNKSGGVFNAQANNSWFLFSGNAPTFNKFSRPAAVVTVVK